METLPPAWVNLGIAGMLAVAFIAAHLHTIKVTIPQLLDRFGVELATERTTNARHVEALIGRLEGVEKAIRELLQRDARRDERGDRPRPFGPDYPHH